MKKDAWKNNLGLKFIALLFSIILWWTVVNIDDPIDKKTFATEVQLYNTDVIAKRGQSFDITNVSNNKSVNVTVKARRKVLESIKASDIVATADFTEHDASTDLVPIRVKVVGFESRVEEVKAHPVNLQLVREDIVTKKFPIQAVSLGNVKEGYIIANVTPKPQSIEISGPGSVVNRISKVVAKVDVTGISENVVLQSDFICYDSADNVLDKATLSSEYDQSGVGVEIEVWRTKTLGLHFDTSEIKTAQGYFFDKIEVEPQTIRVAGRDDIIIPLDKIEVAKEALAAEELKENQQIIVNIADYLPEGIVLADQDASSVVVTVIVEKAGTKTLMVPARSIKVNNASDKFEITYDGGQTVEIKFEGPNEELQALTNEEIVASVDLKEYTEAGTYEVPVQIGRMENQCNYLGGATVQITLTKK